VRELIRELVRLFKQALKQEKQSNSGAGSLQAGRVDGDLTHVTVNNFYAAPEPVTAVEADPPAQQPTVSEVLSLLDQLSALGARDAVLKFMRTEFGTTMVKDLDARALNRTHAYARGVLRRKQEAVHPGPVAGDGHAARARGADRRPLRG